MLLSFAETSLTFAVPSVPIATPQPQAQIASAAAAAKCLIADLHTIYVRLEGCRC